jgi:hypothetical protein
MVARVLMGLLLVASLTYAEDSPGFSSVDSLVVTMGKETSGHTTMCMMTRNNLPVACFGLIKEFKSEAQYTYFIVFKLDPKKPQESHSSGANVNSDGKTSKLEITFDVGDHEVSINVERKMDPDTGKVTEEKIRLGDQEIRKDDTRVFLLDATGDKPKFSPLKVKLPKSVPDLADREQKTWGAAIDKAVAEVKEQVK